MSSGQDEILEQVHAWRTDQRLESSVAANRHTRRHNDETGLRRAIAVCDARIAQAIEQRQRAVEELAASDSE